MSIARVGDRVRFSFSFQRLGTTTAATPPEVTVIYRAPRVAEVVYTLADDPTVIIVDSVGNLHADIRLEEQRGRHYFRAIGDGDPELQKSTEEHLDVAESSFEVPLP